jgi:hypothetical protein
MAPTLQTTRLRPRTVARCVRLDTGARPTTLDGIVLHPEPPRRALPAMAIPFSKRISSDDAMARLSTSDRPSTDLSISRPWRGDGWHKPDMNRRLLYCSGATLFREVTTLMRKLANQGLCGVSSQCIFETNGSDTRVYQSVDVFNASPSQLRLGIGQLYVGCTTR